MKAEQLRKEFAALGSVSRDGALLLGQTDAVELVNRAADEGVPIVRVVGIADAAPAREPAPDNVADFSREVDQGHGCWEEAEAFIRRRSGLALRFDVALGDDPLEVV